MILNLEKELNLALQELRAAVDVSWWHQKIWSQWYMYQGLILFKHPTSVYQDLENRCNILRDDTWYIVQSSRSSDLQDYAQWEKKTFQYFIFFSNMPEKQRFFSPKMCNFSYSVVCIMQINWANIDPYYCRHILLLLGKCCIPMETQDLYLPDNVYFPGVVLSLIDCWMYA